MKNLLLPIALISLIVIGFLGVSAVLGNSPASQTTIDESEGRCGASSESQSSGGCGTGDGCGTGGGCGSGGTAEDYYFSQTGDRDVEITIEDFGCHQEATILKDGQEVMKLSISGGEVTEI